MKNNSTNLISRLKKGVVSLTLVSILPLSLSAQVPFYESFDQAGPYVANNLPFGWSQGKIVGVSTTNKFSRLNVGLFPAGTPTHSGAAMVRYESYNAPVGENAFLCSKPLDLTTRGAAASNFRFWMYRDAGFVPSGAFFDDSIQVYINTIPSFSGPNLTLLSDTVAAGAYTRISRYYLSQPAVAATGWYLYGYTIPAGAPWNTTNTYVLIRGCSRFGNDIHIDDFSTTQYPTNQTFTSCDMVFQNATNIGAGTSAPASNNWVIQIRAIASGAGNPLSVDSLNFNTNGSTLPCTDIVQPGAKLWWMGGTKTLDLTIAQQVGIAVGTCLTNFKINPPAAFKLDNDTNYFWITYDIATLPPAVSGDCVDAEFLGMKVTGVAYSVPTVFSMAGCRQIDLPYCIPTYTVGGSWLNGSYTNNDYVRHVTLAGEVSYGPGIDNALNSNGPNAGGCTGGPCPFSAHPPDYERFAPNPGYTAVMIANGTTTYNLYAQVGTWGSGNYLAAWIDFNGDGDFYDIVGGSNEKITQSTGLAGSTNFPLVGAYPTYGGWWAQAFTVPSVAFIGNTTLRVREVFATSPIDPCATATFGQCEDYTVTIIPDCNVIPALAGWSIWLGGFSNDWNVITNWCGGIPTSAKDAVIIDSTTASNVYLGGLPSPVAPTFFPVIKNGVVATTRKLRIMGVDSVTINAPLPGGGSLSIYDSLNINNATSKLKVISSLVDTAQVSNGNLNSTNAYIFAGGFARRRTWLTYTQAELAAQGMISGDVIDELHIHLRSRATNAAQNYIITISYFYGTAGACFLNGAVGNPIPPITGGAASTTGYPGTTVFSGSINLSGVPGAGGEYIIPLQTPITWVPAGNNLFLEICFNNAAAYVNDPNSYTQTAGCRTFYSINLVGPGAPAGCALLNGTAGTIKLSVETRPNVTFKFHRNYIKYPINMRSTSAAMPGNWGNNGVFEAGNSIVTFMGTSGTQNIDGTVPTTFHELAINNAGHVRQNTSATVQDTLWLTNGRLILNKAAPSAINTLTLNLGTTAAITRTATGYLQSESAPPNYGMLNWKIGSDMNPHVVPFIKALPATDYIPFTYDPTAGTTDLTIGTYSTNNANLPAPTGLPGSCTINYPNYFTSLDNSANMVDRFWIANNAGTGPVADLTFTFAPAESNGGTGFIFSQRWETAICWEAYMLGQSNPTATSNITPGVSGFNSVWALSFNSQPLPIEVVSFDAVPVGDRVKLDWVTASEIDNDYFTIERTKDARSFDFIDQVRSYGPSTSNQYYTTYDNHPLNGLQYYRLKQTDFNSRFSLSNLVPVYFGKDDDAFEIVTVINNDNNSFTVVFKYNSTEPYAYKVMDVTGRTVVSGEGKAVEAGTNLLNINAELAGGIYTLVIQNSNATASRKIFRQ